MTKNRAARTARRLRGFAAGALLLAAGPAFAGPPRGFEWLLGPAPDALSQRALQGRDAPCFSRDDCDRRNYDESGTRGRMGLGASPFHPEGPGNVSG